VISSLSFKTKHGESRVGSSFDLMIDMRIVRVVFL
jgi:hypothetical protein